MGGGCVGRRGAQSNRPSPQHVQCRAIRSALELAIHTAPPKIKSALKPLAQLWPNLFGSQEVEHQIYPALPQNLITALQKAITQITNALADAPQRQDGEYMRFYFDALAFVRLAEEFDDDSLFDFTLDDSQPLRVQSTLAIRNLIPLISWLHDSKPPARARFSPR